MRIDQEDLLWIAIYTANLSKTSYKRHPRVVHHDGDYQSDIGEEHRLAKELADNAVAWARLAGTLSHISLYEKKEYADDY